MPFAEQARAIAVLLEQRGQGHAVALDQGWLEIEQHTFLQTRAPAIPPGKQRVSRGCTKCRRTMRIGKSHSLPCQPIHVRRRDFRARVVTAHIPIPHIICHDENNVRLLCRKHSHRHQIKY